MGLFGNRDGTFRRGALEVISSLQIPLDDSNVSTQSGTYERHEISGLGHSGRDYSGALKEFKDKLSAYGPLYVTLLHVGETRLGSTVTVPKVSVIAYREAPKTAA